MFSSSSLGMMTIKKATRAMNDIRYNTNPFNLSKPQRSWELDITSKPQETWDYIVNESTLIGEGLENGGVWVKVDLCNPL